MYSSLRPPLPRLCLRRRRSHRRRLLRPRRRRLLPRLRKNPRRRLPVRPYRSWHLTPDMVARTTGATAMKGCSKRTLIAQFVARARMALLATNKYRVVLTRAGDTNVSSEQRALAAKLSAPIYFLSFHAGDLGTSSPRIIIFTYQPPDPAPPADADAPPPVFVPWEEAQEGRIGQSRQLALALQQQFALINGVEVDLPSTAPVRTLRSVNAPAVAIELGGLAPDQDATSLTNAAFQQQVATAVVQALASLEKGGN